MVVLEEVISEPLKYFEEPHEKKNVLYDLKDNPQRTGRTFASSVKSAPSVPGMMLLVQQSTISLGGGRLLTQVEVCFSVKKVLCQPGRCCR